MPYIVAGLLIAFVTLAFWKYSSIQAQRKEEEIFAVKHNCAPLPPWISTWPLGLDFLVRAFWHASNRTILNFFLENWEKSAPTQAQKILFEHGIATIDPENLEAMLSKQFEDFDLGIRDAQFIDLLGSGIFTQDGSAWKHSRNLLRPQFASNRFQNFEEIKTSVENMLDQLPKHGIVDLQPYFFDLTLDTTLFLLFGNTANSLRSEDAVRKHREFAKAFSDGQEYLTFRVRLGGLYWLINTPQYWRTCRTVRQFIDEIIQKALDADEKTVSEDRNTEVERYVFLDAILKETKDKKSILDQCLNLLIAGRDTTACCLTWTMWLLARHQSSLAKLRDEIASTVGIGRDSRQPSRDDLKRMKYLNLVIKEVLRLYPSVPVNVRAASRLTTLPVGGGPDRKQPCLVRKGTGITWSPFVMHRRRDLYGEDAHEFRPERWEGDALKDIGWGYLPFNGGPRICLGQDFAILEASYTVVRLLQRFPEITLPDGVVAGKTGDEKKLMALVVSPADGCTVHCREAS